jgi:hypothetical protein
MAVVLANLRITAPLLGSIDNIFLGRITPEAGRRNRGRIVITPSRRLAPAKLPTAELPARVMSMREMMMHRLKKGRRASLQVATAHLSGLSISSEY